MSHETNPFRFAEQYLAAIVQSAEDAIISKDLDGIVTSWNPAAEQIYGYSAEEMIGQSMMRIVPPDLRDEESHILETIRRGGRVQHFETRRIRKDGTTVHLSLTISPITGLDGKVVGASKIARDITEKKALEEREREALEDSRR